MPPERKRRPHWWGAVCVGALLAQTELLDQCAVPFQVLAHEVVEQSASLTHHHEQATTRVMVVLVLFQVFGQVVDPLGQQCDLNLGATRVLLVLAELADDLSLFLSCQHELLLDLVRDPSLPCGRRQPARTSLRERVDSLPEADCCILADGYGAGVGATSLPGQIYAFARVLCVPLWHNRCVSEFDITSLTKRRYTASGSATPADLTVLVVGCGARDHALAWKIAQSPLLGQLHAAPGNPAMESIATCHPQVEQTDFAALVDLAVSIRADLVVVAFENLLVGGLADQLAAAGILCVGPSGAAAQIEGSKAFSKQLMLDAGIPTPFSSTHPELEAALAAIDRLDAPVVVKADGLAGGCGAFVCETHEEARAVARDLMEGDRLGASGSTIIVEQFVVGDEASVMVLADGSDCVPLPAIRDYKRLADNDEGPNTGGMGACSPSAVPAEQIREAVDTIVRPALAEMARRGTPYRGLLYAGVMFTDQGPLALEFNCRFGNPETQVMMRLLESDLLDLLHRAATGRLAGHSAQARDCAAVGVCIGAPNYPDKDLEDKPFDVEGVAVAQQHEGVEVFMGPFAGSISVEHPLAALGGRLATVTATGRTRAEAAARAYAAADRIVFPGKRMRRDVGQLTESDRQNARVLAGKAT